MTPNTYFLKGQSPGLRPDELTDLNVGQRFTRLHVRVLFDGPWLLGQVLALVNLLMMRKQLRVIKKLAEREALVAV